MRTGVNWNDIGTLPTEDGVYLFYNKDWSVNAMQTGKVVKGKLMILGNHFACDYKEPTHWAEIDEPSWGM